MSNRVAKLQQLLKQRNMEALLISYRPNSYYVSGFTGSSGVIIVTQTKNIVVTDFRYVTQAREQSPDFILEEQETSQIYEEVAKVCHRHKISSLFFESEHLTFSQYEILRSALKESVSLKPAANIVELIRSQKEEKELTYIKESIRIAESSFQQLLTEIVPGMTEKQIALRLEWLMRERGASGVSFDMIVASGARSALPHGVASDKPIATGELVTFDFGCFYKGYASDITRTIAIGSCSLQQRQIYEIVHTANKKAIEGIVVGRKASNVDEIARDIITKAGYGNDFGHSTGHGIGLDIHEYPRVGNASEDTLLPGMVITIEPGIYLQNQFGVRIEDDILITENRYEVLTSLPKELIIL